VKLPSSIDVVATPSGISLPSGSPLPLSSRPSNVPDSLRKPVANLPTVIKKNLSPKRIAIFLGGVFVVGLLASGFVLERQPIAKALPGLKGVYKAMGLSLPVDWEGLIFEEVKSELKYDSGTMRLYVDGTIHNTTPDIKIIPDIRARALGADKSVIQSWWVDAPAPTLDPDGRISFHTEVASPMERTIEDVSLDFMWKGGENADK
jgi:hypothetical protein